MKAAQDARINKILDTKAKYDGAVMTRREFLQHARNLGFISKLSETNKIQFSRIKYNRMSSYKEQEEYEKKCNEMIPEYRLYSGERTFWTITKTEFDYFNSLPNYLNQAIESPLNHNLNINQ